MVDSKIFYFSLLILFNFFTKEGESAIAAKSVVMASNVWRYAYVSQVTSTGIHTGCKSSYPCYNIESIHSAIGGTVTTKPWRADCMRSYEYYSFCIERDTGLVKTTSKFKAIPGDIFTIKVSYGDTTASRYQHKTEFTVRVLCPYDFFNHHIYHKSNLSSCYEKNFASVSSYKYSQHGVTFISNPNITFFSHLEIICPSLSSELIKSLIATVEMGKLSCLQSRVKDKSFFSEKKISFIFDYENLQKGSKLVIPLDWTINDHEPRFVEVRMSYFAAKSLISEKYFETDPPWVKIPFPAGGRGRFNFPAGGRRIFTVPAGGKGIFTFPVEPLVPVKWNRKKTGWIEGKEIKIKGFTESVPDGNKLFHTSTRPKPLPVGGLQRKKETKVMKYAPYYIREKSIPLYGRIQFSQSSVKLVGGSYKSLCKKSRCIDSYKELNSTRFAKLSDRCKCCSPIKRIRNICQAQPKLSIDSPKSTVKMGTNAMLSCSFPATLINYMYPLKWLKDGRDAGFGREVESYSTIRNNQRNISVVFEIKDAKQQGNYACMMETLAGRKFTSKNLLLLVKDISYLELHIAKDARNISAKEGYKNITTYLVNKINESFNSNEITFARVFKTKTTNRTYEVGVTFIGMDSKSQGHICNKLKSIEYSLNGHGALKMIPFDCCTSIDDKGPSLLLNSLYTSVAALNDTFKQNTTRRCGWNSTYGAQWKVETVTVYRTAYTFEELAHVNITKRNSLLVSESLLAASSASKESKEVFDIKLAVDIMEKVAATDVLSNPKVAENLLKVSSNIMDYDREKIARSQRHFRTSERILKLLEDVANNVEIKNGSLKIEEKKISLSVFEVDRKNHSGILIEALNTTQGHSRIERKFTSDSVSHVKLQASVFLNPLTMRAALNLAHSTKLRIASFVFENAKLFLPQPPHHIEKQHNNPKHHTHLRRLRKRGKHFQNIFLNSKVISTSFKGVLLRNLSDSALVEISFRPLRKMKGEYSCVYWDFHAADGQGNWSNEGCVNVGMVDGYQKCRCNHLTNFALLLDVNDGHLYLSEKEKKSLSIFTYVGCGISLVCLFITFVTYLAFRKLRSKQPAQVLMLLCLSLMLMMIAFIVGSRTKNGIVCVVFGFLTHYFLLSSFCWMAVEGINLYLCLVKIMRSTISKFMLKCNLFAWGTPAVIVGINLALNEYHSYRRKESHDTICVLTGYDFYLAGLLPMILIMAINIIILILVLRSLSRKSNLGQCNERSNLTKVRIAFGCALLMGITWTVGLFAIGRLTYVVQLIFCALNSLQGFFIFIMYCARHKEVRQEWRKFLNIEFFSSFTSTNKQTKDTKEDNGSGSGSEDATKSKQKQDFAEELNRNETNGTKPYDGAMLINNKTFKVTLPGDEAAVVLLHREDKSSFKR